MSQRIRAKRNATSPPSASDRLIFARRAPHLAIGATFVSMLLFSWGTWPDPLVDFGHELYAPWQISQGKALELDIAWGASGPLSPYGNGLLFALFGPSLLVLVVFNAAVLAAFTTLLWVSIRALTDRFAATVSCLAFLAIFAFGQYVEVGNYNFLTPYSHGATHGVTLSVLCIFLVYRHLLDGRPRDLVFAGLFYGLVFLTGQCLVLEEISMPHGAVEPDLAGRREGGVGIWRG